MLVLLQASRNTKLPDSDWELWLVRLVRECQILGVLDSFGRVSSRAEKLSNCHLAMVVLPVRRPAPVRSSGSVFGPGFQDPQVRCGCTLSRAGWRPTLTRKMR